MDIVDKVKLNIRRLMKAKKLTSYKLSEKCDLTQSGIDKWFKKRSSEPSISSLEKICEHLDVSIAELFCSEDDTMIPLTKEEHEIVLHWQTLNPQQREGLLLFIRGSSKNE